jgi:uncharacterized lipoprotein YmbA
MKSSLAMTLVALSTIAVLSGCAGKVGRTNYYSLDLPAPPDPPAAENAHTTVAIREFRAPAYLSHRVQTISRTNRLLCVPPLGD